MSKPEKTPRPPSMIWALPMAVLVVLAGCAAPPAEEKKTDVAQETTAAAATTTAAVDNGSQDCITAGSRTTINQAGSSTVLPVAEAWAEEFGRCLNANIVVGGGGTGSGFKRFCRGELDISDASRPIKDTEKADCAANGIDPVEVQIAIDGLAVVINPANTWVDHLTVKELNMIWTATAANQANTWSQVRDGWPNEEIELFGPGTDSGTFDYFVEVIIHPFDGTSSKGRSDYNPSEDDNILVQGVSSNKNALGYFGLAYARENPTKVKIVPIDDEKAENGAGPVLPTDENVESGKYAPLARPIFMYTDGAPTGTLSKYFMKGLGETGQELVAEVGYIKLPEDVRQEMLGKVT